MQCQSCMMGTYVNGICTHCHRRQKSAAERDPSALPLGLVLHQRYRLGNVLGRGGFGITYTAWDQQQNIPVAVKELFPNRDVRRESDGKTVSVMRGQEAYFAQISQRFSEEAGLLLKLQEKPSVVRVYHLFQEHKTLYYVMEYLDGMDLNAWLQHNGPMPWSKLSGIISTVLKALDALHAVGLIHRDLSPDNIFLSRDGSVRLIDFGSVRAYEGTSHFTVFVKKSFAPWEQYQTNSAQGPWTDIYSLCVTMYFALSGKLPPVASERRLQDQAVPIQTLCPDLPQHVADAIAYGMAVRPEARCQSAAQLHRLLFPAVHPSGKPAVRVAAPPRPAVSSCQVYCLRGYFAGRRWLLTPGKPFRVGRQLDCDVVYPPETKGVSRLQCSFLLDPEGRLLVRDEGSSYGTFLGVAERGMRLSPGQWYVAKNCKIFFGIQEEYAMQ